MEKQILVWPRSDDRPAALGALLLLPHVATLGDEIWWSRRADQPWERRDFVLSIQDSEHQPLRVDEQQLAASIARGCQALRAEVSEDSLVALYSQLLSGRKTAWLAGLEQPLPPEAVAALMLPLPRRRADQLSIAGWVPSSRVNADQLARRWQLVVGPSGGKLAPSVDRRDSGYPAAETDQIASDAWALAQSLREGDPDRAWPVAERRDLPAEPESTVVVARSQASPVFSDIPASGWDLFAGAASRPGVKLALPSPSPDSPWVLRALYAFACAADRRWITPKDLSHNGHCRPLSPEDPDARLLLEWVSQVERQRPDYAHSEQWAVKVDLLRAAVLALVPAPSSLEAVGPLTTAYVPPLLFGGLLAANDRDSFAAFNTESLSRLIQDSLECSCDELRESVELWLGEWHGQTGRQEVQRLLAGRLPNSNPSEGWI